MLPRCRKEGTGVLASTLSRGTSPESGVRDISEFHLRTLELKRLDTALQHNGSSSAVRYL